MIFNNTKSEINAIELRQAIRNMMNCGNSIASIKEIGASK